MPLTHDEFRAARDGNRNLRRRLLAEHFPMVRRLAGMLTGRADVAHSVLRHVMVRSLHNLPAWADMDEATRWFRHFTIQTSRRASAHAPEAQADLLIDAAHRENKPYAAFIRAIRRLPQQHRVRE